MRTLLKISYTCYIKNPSRPSAHYYGRVREAGHAVDVDLHTKVKAVAEAWVALRRSEVERYNQYVLVGEEPPKDLEEQLVRTTKPITQQKAVSEAISLQMVCLPGWEAELRRVGRRERTVATYTRAIRVIVPKGATTADMTVDCQRAWLGAFDCRKSATRRFYSVALREFSKYCAKYYGTTREVVDDFVHVKVESAEKPWLTMTQIYHLIDAVETKDKVREKVAKAYFWTLATTGCRQGEGYELRWSDLSDDNVLTFRAETTKSGKTRRVPLDWRIARLIRRLPVEGSRIFAALPRSQSGRFRILQRAAEKCKLPHIGLHTLRHSASMLIYSKTNDLKAAAELLGHEETTALRYYQASRQAEQLRATVDKAFEGEHMMPSPIEELIDAGLW